LNTYKGEKMRVIMPATLYKSTRDSDGEVTLVFKIPQSDAKKSTDIPVQEELALAVEWHEKT
jgi:hypothetical protein